jgi:hypothetical protein
MPETIDQELMSEAFEERARHIVTETIRDWNETVIWHGGLTFLPATVPVMALQHMGAESGVQRSLMGA